MKYHLIGIDGISMSGLAQLLISMGNDVNGCDIKNCQIDKWLNCQNNNLIIKQPASPVFDSEVAQTRGAGGFNNKKIYNGHNPDHITNDLDGVIVTAAAMHENSPAKSEITKAKELKIPIIKRSEMIGRLMNEKIGIAVAGMHGKTTVSTMIALILEHAGFDPAALIGSNVKEWGTNYRAGSGEYFVAEACEYEKQMLNFRPKIEVITNLDTEHLDTYPGGMKDIKKSFKKFIKELPRNGMLIVWREDKNLMQLAQIAKKRGNIVRDISQKKIWPGLKLKIPGRHNLINATFAARVCHELGVKSKIIKEVLNNFTGSERRFELKGIKNGISVIDDYGHHPSEIKATVEAAHEWLQTRKPIGKNKQKLIVVFQPHQFVRTKLLFNDFAKAFNKVDILLLTDIYLIAGREPIDARADYSKELTNAIKDNGVNAIYVKDYEGALRKINQIALSGDLVLTLGATDVYKVGEKFLEIN